MEILMITGVQAEAFLRALCWTFIHSLWQGLGYALMAGMLLLSTKRSAPALRYNLLSLILLLFVITAGITFYLQLPRTSGQGSLAPVLPARYSADTAAVKFTWQQFAAYCDAYAPLLVLLWFIVFLTRFINLIGGLLHIKRIRNYGASSPGAEWQERVVELATVLHISIPVKLLESALIKVPVMVGWLKPVIMIPAGLLTQLPQDQIEAILLHELAHIRRKDYFVNIMQSFMEILFFFNPAVRWLSALLREEREHCCDDLAINGIHNKTTYIKALVAFQEYLLGDTPSPVPAFADSKYQLLDRVKRMVYNNNKSLNVMEKIFLTTSIIVLVGITFVPLAKTQAQKYHVLEQRTATDTIPAVKPDNSLQHITNGSAETAEQDTLADQRDAVQQEREKAQQTRDSIQLRRMQVQQTRDHIQLRRMHDQQLRDREDSLRREAQIQRDIDAAYHEKQGRLHEEESRKQEERARSIAGEVVRAEANGTAQKNNVSRNVPVVKPITPVEPVSAIELAGAKSKT